MSELVESHATRADRVNRTTPRVRQSIGKPHNGPWAAISIALMLGLPTLGIFATHDANRGNQISDAELTTDFFAHEAAFDELVRMLSTDYPSLAAKGAAAIDLATIAGQDKNPARLGTYRRLLRQISVADFRYFPDSGKLILVPDGLQDLERPSESFLYLPHGQPQSFVRHHEYYWRGPGVDTLTRDRRLKDSWLIRHEITLEVAASPY